MAQTARQLYNKERRRVTALLRRMEKEGFLYAKEQLPPIPKRPTLQSVEALKKITRESVARKTQYFVNYETGEFVSGTKAYLRKKSGQDPFMDFSEIQRIKKEVKEARKKQKKEASERKKQEDAAKQAQQPQPQQQTQAQPQQPVAIADEADVVIDALIADLKTIVATTVNPTRYRSDYYRKKALNESREHMRDLLLAAIDEGRKKDKNKLAKRIIDAGDKVDEAVNAMRISSDQTEVEAAWGTLMNIVNI